MAGILITLFAVSLAMAQPADKATSGATSTLGARGPVLAARDSLDDGLSGSAFGQETGMATDAVTPDDTPILSRPLSPPNYHDRYRFYHRYDHELRARFNPIESER
jgi:hypothetical protein